VRRQNPDYFDLVVMNAILGGLFSSRINLNLREKHGYTYGAFSSVDWRHEAGPLAVSTAVRSDVTAESVREILSEIAMLSAAPVSQDELSLALNYLIGVFPIRFETAAAIAGALAALVVYELPDDYYDRYRAEIGLVTQESVQRAARKYLRQEELQIVMVGDAAVAGKSLREFSAAEPTVIDSSKGILD
jgi:predicted Zn-dependent peptidase